MRGQSCWQQRWKAILSLIADHNTQLIATVCDNGMLTQTQTQKKKVSEERKALCHSCEVPVFSEVWTLSDIWGFRIARPLHKFLGACFWVRILHVHWNRFKIQGRIACIFAVSKECPVGKRQSERLCYGQKTVLLLEKTRVQLSLPPRSRGRDTHATTDAHLGRSSVFAMRSLWIRQCYLYPNVDLERAPFPLTNHWHAEKSKIHFDVIFSKTDPQPCNHFWNEVTRVWKENFELLSCLQCKVAR